MLPQEVQGYIRHILHSLGVLIVSYGGFTDSNLDMYVGLFLNLISVAWFLYMQFKKN